MYIQERIEKRISTIYLFATSKKIVYFMNPNFRTYIILTVGKQNSLQKVEVMFVQTT